MATVQIKTFADNAIGQQRMFRTKIDSFMRRGFLRIGLDVMKHQEFVDAMQERFFLCGFYRLAARLLFVHRIDGFPADTTLWKILFRRTPGGLHGRLETWKHVVAHASLY